MAISWRTCEDPPYETNGSGTPVTGMIPSVMPMFSNIWKVNQQTIPVATSRPNRSSARSAIRHARHSTTPSSTMIAAAPTKPSSSPATVKMKSVCCSGTNLPLVCVPWNRPVPVAARPSRSRCAPA